MDPTCSFPDDVVAVVAADNGLPGGMDGEAADPGTRPTHRPRARGPRKGEEEGPRGRVRCEQYSSRSLQTKDEGDAGSWGCRGERAKRATDLLREADVPAWTLVKDTVDPGKTLKGLLGRSRAGTVRL